VATISMYEHLQICRPSRQYQAAAAEMLNVSTRSVASAASSIGWGFGKQLRDTTGYYEHTHRR